MRALLISSSLLLSLAAHAAPPTATVCHEAGGQVLALVLPDAAVSAHMRHGDWVPFTVFSDADGDGFGDASAPLEGVCEVPQGFVEDASDCDDTDPWVNPDVVEVLGNGIDDDCDADTLDDACVEVLKHCTSNRNRSPLLRTVCASDGTVVLTPFENNNASYIAFGEGVTEVQLVNRADEVLWLEEDQALCELGGNRGPWNDEIVSVTVFVD